MSNRIEAEFFHISVDQAYKDGITQEEYERITLPERATEGSAGYDFVSLRDVLIAPGETVLVPTGIRCRIEHGYNLDLHVRSSLGIKRGLRLANITGIIDEDYFNGENEGHIWAAMHNDGKVPAGIKAGERFVQGVFREYFIVCNDAATLKRIGGIGSTNK